MRAQHACRVGGRLVGQRDALEHADRGGQPVHGSSVGQGSLDHGPCLEHVRARRGVELDAGAFACHRHEGGAVKVAARDPNAHGASVTADGHDDHRSMARQAVYGSQAIFRKTRQHPVHPRQP